LNEYSRFIFSRDTYTVFIANMLHGDYAKAVSTVTAHTEEFE